MTTELHLTKWTELSLQLYVVVTHLKSLFTSLVMISSNLIRCYFGEIN